MLPWFSILYHNPPPTENTFEPYSLWQGHAANDLIPMRAKSAFTNHHVLNVTMHMRLVWSYPMVHFEPGVAQLSQT